jgi:hypothetical protein
MPYLLLALLIFLPPITHAEIYKWVDEKGIHFSDEAPPGIDAEKVIVKPPNISTPSHSAPASHPSTPSADEDPEGKHFKAQKTKRYAELKITHPNNDQALRENNGKISITCSLSPTLQSSAGHQVRFILDGQPFSVVSSCSTTIEEIDRGSHQVSAEVIDAQGRVLLRSNTNTFHLQRHSRL